MDSYIDKLIRIIERGMLSPVSLADLLLTYATEDRSALQRLMAVTKPEDLGHVYEILFLYPQTEIGWSILPAGRAPFLNPEHSRKEAFDVDRRQYQEDRPHVEYLRDLIRPGTGTAFDDT